MRTIHRVCRAHRKFGFTGICGMTGIPGMTGMPVITGIPAPGTGSIIIKYIHVM